VSRIDIKDYGEDSYRAFLHAKTRAIHRVRGHSVFYDDDIVSIGSDRPTLAGHLFDYQEFITQLCLAKRRFAVFADVGLGKTAIFLEWIRHVSKVVYPKKTLIITQLHLINQTMEEQLKFYGWSNITNINRAFGGHIDAFLAVPNSKFEGLPVGIVNVDKFRNEYRLQDHVGAIVLDESSCLKNETGKIRNSLINSCKGIPWKLCCTATPAPNDRQEYANHALFLGYIDNFKQFFTKFFYNTGSGNDFQLKPHAMTAFYEFLAHWSIFLKHPSHYGFDDNLVDLLPAEVIWNHIELTNEQRKMAIKHGSGGQLNMFGNNAGGITQRNKASQIAKGFMYES
jgi:hypothetical protein